MPGVQSWAGCRATNGVTRELTAVELADVERPADLDPAGELARDGRGFLRLGGADAGDDAGGVAVEAAVGQRGVDIEGLRSHARHRGRNARRSPGRWRVVGITNNSSR